MYVNKTNKKLDGRTQVANDDGLKLDKLTLADGSKCEERIK